MQRMSLGRGAVLMILLFGIAATPASAQETSAEGDAANGDRHAGYYYPEPASREIYKARAQRMPKAGRGLRIGFVTGISIEMAKRPYTPSYAIFAKGTEAEKLIIVALADGPLDTLYRARAVLADLTAMSRLSPVFQDLGVQDWFTFFDLAKMMGFTRITVSDGRGFAHQIAIE
jgi:hypothetical protein